MKTPLNNSNNKFCPLGKLSWSWMELFKCFHLQRHSTCQVSQYLLYLKSHWDFLGYWLCKSGATWLTCFIFGHMPTWYVSVSSPVNWLEQACLQTEQLNFRTDTPPPHGLPYSDFALVASEVPDYNYRVSVRLGCKLHMAAPEMIHPGHTWITCSSAPHPQSDFWREKPIMHFTGASREGLWRSYLC